MLKNIQVKILDKRLGEEFPLPSYATEGSAGLDLRACIKESGLIIDPGDVQLISSGIAVYIQHRGVAGLIVPRSGLGHKHGIILGNSLGLIDSDYQGEIMISCWNRSTKPFEIMPGDRIAQMVLVSVFHSKFEVVDDFILTDRGIGGFGHTGSK